MGASSWLMRVSKDSIRYVALCRLLRSGWLLGSSAVWICIHHSVRQSICNAVITCCRCACTIFNSMLYS